MGRSSWQQVMVKAPPCTPDRLAVFTAGERPDLWSVASGERPFTELWPEYNHRGNSAGLYSGALYPGLAHIQALSVDRRSSQLAGRAPDGPPDAGGPLRRLSWRRRAPVRPVA